LADRARALEEERVERRARLEALRLARQNEEAETLLPGEEEGEAAEEEASSSDEEVVEMTPPCKSKKSVALNALREKDEAEILVDPGLCDKLQVHQVEGIQFLWENVCESTAKLAKNSVGLGCILAHNMGLGKTLQVVCFVHTLLTNKSTRNTIRTVLICAPVNVTHNWCAEFEKWQKHCKTKVLVHMLPEVNRGSANKARIKALKMWQERGGVFLLGYEAYRDLALGATRGMSKKQKDEVAGLLVDPGPDVLVCDEAHMVKNAKAGVTKAVSSVRTRRRIALTGSPLQNNLSEYYEMVNPKKTLNP
jgi:transcriptional regulator ATRX